MPNADPMFPNADPIRRFAAPWFQEKRAVMNANNLCFVQSSIRREYDP
jgi:hypothetical protein